MEGKSFGSLQIRICNTAMKVVLTKVILMKVVITKAVITPVVLAKFVLYRKKIKETEYILPPLVLLNLGSKIRDPRSGIRDLGSVIRDPRSGIQDRGSKTRDPRPGIQDPGWGKIRISDIGQTFRIRNNAIGSMNFGSTNLVST